MPAYNTDADARLQERIQQLLAKAESTTPEEAEALTAAAERLMVKHGIDQAMIDARRAADSRPEEIVEVSITFTGEHCQGLYFMAAAVVKAFGTMRVLHSGKGRYWQTIYIVGHESDVAQAKLLVESLHLQAIVAMRQWWTELKAEGGHIPLLGTQAEKRNAKKSFLVGFGSGAGTRIEQATTETVAETTGSELVLLDRKALVDADTERRYPSLSKGRRMSTGGGGGGYSAGHAAGQRANTGGSAVGGSAAIGR